VWPCCHKHDEHLRREHRLPRPLELPGFAGAGAPPRATEAGSGGAAAAATTARGGRRCFLRRRIGWALALPWRWRAATCRLRPAAAAAALPRRRRAAGPRVLLSLGGGGGRRQVGASVLGVGVLSHAIVCFLVVASCVIECVCLSMGV